MTIPTNRWLTLQIIDGQTLQTLINKIHRQCYRFEADYICIEIIVGIDALVDGFDVCVEEKDLSDM